jgi:hypothetical protein
MADPRDGAMTALILGFFASSWFGWAQERPPASWRVPLIAGAVLSLAVAALGAVFAWLHWSSGGSALGEPDAMRRYGIIVGLEFGIAAAGVIALTLWRQTAYIAPWVCLVVGVHFWPLAPVLQNPALVPLGALLAVIAVAAVLTARRTALTPSAITGAGAGAALLAFAAWGVFAAAT